MAKQVLTDRALKALKPAPRGKRLDMMDAVVPGFGVRVTDKTDASGKAAQRTFILVARFPGSSNPTRRAIGDCGKLSLEQARETARSWHEMIRKGIDPATEARRETEAAATKRDNTFGAVMEEFIKRHVHGKRKAADVEREIRKELLPRWRDKPVTEISRRDVVAMAEEIADRGAMYQAHNCLGHVRTFFNWAINRGLYGLEVSPCDRIKPAQLIGAKEPRQRVLTDAEIAALWRAAEALAYPLGPLYRLLLLTGQRKTEVAEARWQEFDLAAKLWTIPPERFKSDATHLVPLSDDAVALLESLPRFSGDFVFTTTAGAKPVNGFSKAKARLDTLMEAELGAAPAPWVIHDIRRTVRTRLSGLRVPEPVAEMVIGHARKGLSRVYDQHAYLDEMREALDAWSMRLRSIVNPPPTNVVPMKARA